MMSPVISLQMAIKNYAKKVKQELFATLLQWIKLTWQSTPQCDNFGSHSIM